MDLKEVIVNQRAIYIKQLQEFYLVRENGAKEILLAYTTKEPVLLFNLSRMDYLEQVDGEYKIEELPPDTYMSHQPVVFQQGNLSVSLHPFFWHGCEFVLQPSLADTNFIENWAKKWLDEDETLGPSGEGFSNAIHNVTIPENTESKTKFTVDFGTASEDCFMELIEVFEKNGVQSVTINSFDLTTT